MKVMIPVSEKSMDSVMDERFARAPFFAVIDTKTDEVEWIENTMAEAHGAGPKVVQFFVNKGVDAFVGPQFGENAIKAIHAANVKAYVAEKKTVTELVKELKNGQLQEIK